MRTKKNYIIYSRVAKKYIFSTIFFDELLVLPLRP